MPAHMFFTYSLILFVIPRYLVKGKYIFSAALVLLACVLTAMLSNLIYLGLVNKVNHFLFPGIEFEDIHPHGSYFVTLLAGLRGGLTVGGMGAAIKLMKYFYFKEQRNLQLQKENMESQLQVLKAQIHPHFLFNTMNNIYSYTQNTSPEASRLVMGLSDILRYMLYDCNDNKVDLSKELQYLQNYIDLQKIRFSDKAYIDYKVDGKVLNQQIVPLLLIAFIENAFKHGVANNPLTPIRLLIDVDEEHLHFYIQNKKHTNNRDASGGIGLNNVKRRLNLLYPNKYNLDIRDEAHTYTVELSLVL